MKLSKLQSPLIKLFESRDTIKDNTGRIIGYFEKSSKDIIVYSHENKYLGRASKLGTFDYSNRKLSPQNEPALLFTLLSL